MTKKRKLLSIVTVVKNDVKSIEKTIKSIIFQKNKEVEYIIIDGKSKDGTTKVINKYKFRRIKFRFRPSIRLKFRE